NLPCPSPRDIELIATLQTLNSSSDTRELISTLQTLNDLTADVPCGAASAEFKSSYYTRTLQVLISRINVDWVQKLTVAQRRDLWDGLFFHGPPEQALLVLMDGLGTAGRDHLVDILEEFLRSGGLDRLLWSYCQGQGPRDSPQLREALLGRLAGLPDLTANRLHPHNRELFLPERYCALLANALLHALENTCQALRNGCDCSLVFVAQVLGKVCIHGNSALVFGLLAPRLSLCTRSDVVWQRVSWKLMENVPERWLEPVVTGMVLAIGRPAALSRVLGNLVLKNKKAQFLLTHKMLLLQYHHPVRRHYRTPSLSLCLSLSLSVYVSQTWCLLDFLSVSSDDDLTPYDMSCDQELSKATPPRYLSDCMDGIGILTHLIIYFQYFRYVSVQMARVLLHLEDRFSTPGFLSLRHTTMVALAVTDPAPVAKYLTSEFYSLNYSLRQRLDMLEVLAMSAQELSQPIRAGEAPNERAALVAEVTSYPGDDPVHWRQVVERRIQGKTRRISKGVTRPPAKGTANRYAPVAGHFFFPLLQNHDRPQVTFDLLGSDHLVLGRLIHTLGLLVHLAVNAPVAPQMGRALLDFVWALRYHADQMVRRGVLFAVCSVFLSMPSESLLTELSETLFETRAWLADVAEADTDADCRSLAVQSLVLLEKSLKRQLEAP
uniref:Telomere length regulation protein TEL2 homolog n=1 Tax=Gadus morhua TaxID=8049 RepID=A0A8C5B3V9_GADMO